MNTTDTSYIFTGPNGDFDIRTASTEEQHKYLAEANNAGDREAVLVLHELLGLPMPAFQVQEQAERIAAFVPGDNSEDAAWKVLDSGGTFQQAVLAAKMSNRRTITNGDQTWEYDPADFFDQVWVQVQPHQGKQESYIDFPDLVEQRCREWLAGRDWNDEMQDIEDALDAGDLIPALDYDKQWAKVTPLSELDDEALLRIVPLLERSGIFLNVTDDETA